MPGPDSHSQLVPLGPPRGRGERKTAAFLPRGAASSQLALTFAGGSSPSPPRRVKRCRSANRAPHATAQGAFFLLLRTKAERQADAHSACNSRKLGLVSGISQQLTRRQNGLSPNPQTLPMNGFRELSPQTPAPPKQEGGIEVKGRPAEHSVGGAGVAVSRAGGIAQERLPLPKSNKT